MTTLSVHPRRRPPSTSEAAARQRKAEAIAAVLRAKGATPEAAAALPQSHRVMAATVAGQRPPSPHTWAVVVNILRATAS